MIIKHITKHSIMFKYFIKEMEQYPSSISSHFKMTKGWGNGYVIIPKDHWLHGIHYNDVSLHIEVHGGLTFSNYTKVLKPKTKDHSWCFGFDTAHFGDSLKNWPKEKVLKETEALARQLWNLKLWEKETSEYDSNIHCEVCANTQDACFC